MPGHVPAYPSNTDKSATRKEYILLRKRVAGMREREAGDGILELLTNLLGGPRVVDGGLGESHRLWRDLLDGGVRVLDLQVVARRLVMDGFLAVQAEVNGSPDRTAVADPAFKLGVGDLVDPGADVLGGALVTHDYRVVC
jgi:hypothetical protein